MKNGSAETAFVGWSVGVNDSFFLHGFALVLAHLQQKKKCYFAVQRTRLKSETEKAKKKTILQTREQTEGANIRSTKKSNALRRFPKDHGRWDGNERNVSTFAKTA